MSDNEGSDEELLEIIREYAEKEKQDSKPENKNATQPIKNEKAKKSSAASTKTIEWIKTEEEIQLEKLIFGDKEGLLENLKKASKSHRPADDGASNSKKRKAAWHDEDDDALQLGDVAVETKRTGPLDYLKKDKSYKEHLKSNFQRIAATPKWADLDREEAADSDSDEEILKTVGFVDPSKTKALPATNIDFKKLKDLNHATYAEGKVSSVQFHPTSTVGLVCGESGIATLYAVDGRENEKLHSIRFQDFPIRCGKLLPNGTEALFASHRKYFYSYDLMKAAEKHHGLPSHLTKIRNFEVSPCGKYFAAEGRFGELHLFDVKSKEFLHTFKQEHAVRSIQFTSDSKQVVTNCESSTVSIFDIRQQRLMHSFTDDGCIQGRALALSRNGRMLATGSGEGVVNVYLFEKALASKTPKPEKVALNLTTPISQLKFNHNSEILAMCSVHVPGAVKLLHFPTGTVFANFPGLNTDVKYIRTMDFSPASGFLAMAGTQREANLFRLKHYENY